MDKFMQYFQVLGKGELIAFELFLHAPPPLYSELDHALQGNFRQLALELLLPLAREGKLEFGKYWEDEAPLRHRCWTFLFPGKAFDIKQLSAGFTPLHRLLEAFLAYRNMLEQQFHADHHLHLLRSLRGRVPKTAYEKALEKEPPFVEGTFLTETALEYNYRIALEYHNAGINRFKYLKSKDPHLEISPLLQAERFRKWLDLLRGLKWRVVYLNHNIYRRELAPLPTAPDPAAVQTAVSQQIFAAYLLVEKLLADLSGYEQHWPALLGILREPQFPAMEAEGKELFNFAIQIGTRHYNRSDRCKKTAETLLDLYERGWGNGALLLHHSVNSQHYVNACIYSLRLDEIDRAKRLVGEWKEKLAVQSLEEGLVQFNAAQIAYAEKRFQDAAKELAVYHPRDMRKLNKYVLEVKVFAHIDPELAIFKINTFLKWLASGKMDFAPQRVENEKGRMQLARRIFKLAPYDAKSASILEQDIEKWHFDREWLRGLFLASLEAGR